MATVLIGTEYIEPGTWAYGATFTGQATADFVGLAETPVYKHNAIANQLRLFSDSCDRAS